MTSKLIPYNQRNFEYILINTTFSRFLVALARCYQNLPSVNRHHDYTADEKLHAFLERINLEILGTIGFMASTNIGSDLTAKLFEKQVLKKIPQLPEKSPEGQHGGLSPAKRKEINGLLHDFYHGSVSGSISRLIFDGGHYTNLKERFAKHGMALEHAPELAEVRNIVYPFVKKLAVAGSVSLLVGVVSGAFFGGYLMQTFNDGIYRKYAIPWLEKHFSPHSEAPVPEGPKQQPPAGAFSAYTPAVSLEDKVGPMRFKGVNNLKEQAVDLNKAGGTSS